MMKNKIQNFINKYWRKIIIFTLIAISIGVVVYMVSYIHAQGLIGDDYSFLTNDYKRDGNVLSLVAKIIFTLTTPHVRFVFIPHLLFIPFFRYTMGQQPEVNLFFLIILGVMVATGLVLVKVIRNILRIRKIEITKLQGVCYLTVFISLLLNLHVWVLLDFKIASYQAFGAFAFLVFFYFLFRLNLKNKKEILFLLIMFIFAVHSTDLNLLLIIPSTIVILTKTLNRKVKATFIGLTSLYPILFYVVNGAIKNRENAIFQPVDFGTLIDHVLNVVLKQFVALNFSLIALITILILGSCLILLRNRRNLRKIQFPDLLKGNLLLLTTVFTFIYSFLILGIAGLAYGGSVSPHHYSYSYLMLDVTLVLSIATIFSYLIKKTVLRTLLTFAIGLWIATIFFQNFSNFNISIKLRENEMHLLESARNYILTNVDGYPLNNYLIFTSWPEISFKAYNGYYPYSYNSIYDISWAMDGYSLVNFENQTGKNFKLFSPIYLNPNIKAQIGKELVFPTENVNIIVAYYNKDKNKLEFKEEYCARDCANKALEILEPFRPDYLR